MKFLTNKKWLCIWVVLILLVGVLLAAGTASSEPPTEVTDELLAQIEKDYAEYRHENNPKCNELWPIVYCYGIYNGCVAVMFDGLALEHVWTDEIAGIDIHYCNSISILLWKSGDFLPLDAAYEQGILTITDIETIAEIHHNRNQNR